MLLASPDPVARNQCDSDSVRFHSVKLVRNTPTLQSAHDCCTYLFQNVIEGSLDFCKVRLVDLDRRCGVGRERGHGRFAHDGGVDRWRRVRARRLALCHFKERDIRRPRPVILGGRWVSVAI